MNPSAGQLASNAERAFAAVFAAAYPNSHPPGLEGLYDFGAVRRGDGEGSQTHGLLKQLGALSAAQRQSIVEAIQATTPPTETGPLDSPLAPSAFLPPSYTARPLSRAASASSLHYTALPTRSGRVPHLPAQEGGLETRESELFNNYFDFPSEDDEDLDFQPRLEPEGDDRFDDLVLPDEFTSMDEGWNGHETDDGVYANLLLTAQFGVGGVPSALSINPSSSIIHSPVNTLDIPVASPGLEILVNAIASTSALPPPSPVVLALPPPSMHGLALPSPSSPLPVPQVATVEPESAAVGKGGKAKKTRAALKVLPSVEEEESDSGNSSKPRKKLKPAPNRRIKLTPEEAKSRRAARSTAAAEVRRVKKHAERVAAAARKPIDYVARCKTLEGENSDLRERVQDLEKVLSGGNWSEAFAQMKRSGSDGVPARAAPIPKPGKRSTPSTSKWSKPAPISQPVLLLETSSSELEQLATEGEEDHRDGSYEEGTSPASVATPFSTNGSEPNPALSAEQMRDLMRLFEWASKAETAR